METFKTLCSLNIGKISFGVFQFINRDELFTKDEYELEISKTRKKLVKELEDDIITERAKTINTAVKEIEALLTDGTQPSHLGLIKDQLAKISNSLFSEPEVTKAV